jgi:hypothetical protein
MERPDPLITKWYHIHRCTAAFVIERARFMHLKKSVKAELPTSVLQQNKGDGPGTCPFHIMPCGQT